ncbi:MAG: hypothetical protein BGO41_09705 [Clostridiales bacterium 38-18]|nr:MAG: hypothetical protein BGO41_09705 [Clostridiales bacterium 38-18]
MKKTLIILLTIITILGSIPLDGILSFALVVGTSGGADVEVTDVKYAISHEVFQITNGYIEILGENLKDVEVLFEKYGQGFVSMGTRVINSSTFVKFNLNTDETQAFIGRVRIGNRTINLNTGTFPNIQSSNKQTVNKDQTPNSITFTGNYLNTINTGNITGTYGSGLSSATLGTGSTSSTLTLNNPTNPGSLGYQNIILRKTVTADPNIEIEYTYQNAFRIIEDLNLDDVRMFPNTGAKGDSATGVLGDEVYFRADNFSDTRNYQVYFLKALDGSDKFTSVNKAQFVSLGLNVNGNEDVLTVRLPNNKDFERRNYYVVITDVQNGQVVAEQVVLRQDGSYDEFTVIQADYKPSIVSIYPEKGPDTGGNVEIKALNLLTLNIPDLTTTGAFKVNPTSESNDEILVLNYADGVYKGENVTIERKINMQIGKKVKFYKDTDGNFQIIKAATDQVMVVTDSVTDAETNPFKDVIIEISTVLEIKDGVNAGKQFVFNQIITKTNGFEFEPSTFTPVIDSFTPGMVQIEDTATSYSKLKNETLIAIQGDKFLVDRFVDTDGSVITRKPTVLVKKNDNNTFNNRYQLGFFPNEEYTGGGVTVRGIIKYKLNETDATEQVLTYSDGKPVPLDMVVLDDNGNLVDGTSSNQIGTKILIRIPSSALIADGGIKHIQVTNPTRKSADYGKSSIKSDFVEFIKTSDIPVIESVKPNIITVEGGETITITGSNLQNGLKLFLDGEEITSFTRELDTTGNKILVKFKAPPGREGTTQVQILNPSGGLAVSDFTYVKTFNKDPIFNSFTPPLGTYGTIVVVNGDNFLKPDPTAVTERGIDAYRLIGTRILLDGKEVNSYKRDTTGNIIFDVYAAPSEEALIKLDAGKSVYSKFASNSTTVDQSTGAVVTLSNDADGNPAILTATEVYAIKYSGGSYQAYNKNDVLIGAANIAYNSATAVTTISISGGPTFVSTMDNNLIRIGLNEEGNKQVFLSDYVDSVTLKSADGERFTLSYNFLGQPILTNGKDKSYVVKYEDLDQIVAQDSIGYTRPIVVNDQGISLDGTQLDMITPYTVNSATGRIDGNLTKVLSKNQIIFTVPYLSTGKGYKDISVVNPDTKSASKTGNNGFYYITQATSNPIITTIEPSKGSVDGGYYVTISGSDFEDDVRVFIDSVEVPAADTYVALDGSWIKIKMPKSIKKLNEDYGVDELAVPVVIVNPDGGNTGRDKGFTYIIPMSDPVISRIVPTGGSSNGGEIVEIIGYEFRFYEPYENTVGGPNYDLGDIFVDQFKNGVWDDLLSAGVDPNAVTAYPELTNPYYDVYYDSVILPKVYFGENEAKIVEYSKGFIKVITPAHSAGAVDVYVINNDSGVSNKVKYTYNATTPVINSIVPNFGRRQGQEPKDIYGSKLYRSLAYGYKDDDATQIQLLSDVQALVRFGTIDNRSIDRNSANSGLINNQRSTVNLDGGLSLSYYGDLGQVKLTVTENNVIYSRTFDYDNTVAYLPLGMLQNSAGDYYVPNGLKNVDNTVYSGNAYEYVKLEISDRRVFVERGYSPKVTYDNDTHVTVVTPSYYTIGSVTIAYYNSDGGKTTKTFTYTNPASEPKIFNIEPQTLSFDETRWLVETSMDGGIDIEIIGNDFRDNVSVYIGAYKATIKEVTTKQINGITYDLIVATVPKATVNDVDKEYPIMIQNEDKGLATSNNLLDLIGPNYGSSTLPFFFVYKKPLSGPRIDKITPTKTSIYGGNKIVIVGSDFREGAYVIIGTRAGIPIYNGVISDRGTVLTFTTPNNMTLGAKGVQVLNNDYGIAIKNPGITVVSAPTLSPVITDENDVVLNRIHVTGGQVIKLKGTGFAEGATVYFGGEWLTKGSSDTVAETEQGIYRDDSIKFVKDGIKATKVEFVDSETLLVTTPVVDFEGDVTIVVKNSDGGITDNSVKLNYTVPIPKDPSGLKVSVVDNRYIKLYDFVSDTANYFEIYVYIGTKSNYELMSNDYRDFKYLGITNIEPYKITTLPGLENMSLTDRVVFVVKAVNKFGSSGYSNIAALTYENTKNIEELGPEDLDGDLGVPSGQDYNTVQNGSIITVNLASKITKGLVNIDLSDSVTAQMTTKRILLPEGLVRTGLTSITIEFGNSQYRFTPVAANTATFRSVADLYSAYARIAEDTSMSTSRAYLTPNIRGKKQVSKVHSVSFDASSNELTKSFTQLASTMDLTLYYDATGLTTAGEAQIQMYKYNPSTGTYTAVSATVDTINNRVTARIKDSGHYVLLANR